MHTPIPTIQDAKPVLIPIPAEVSEERRKFPRTDIDVPARMKVINPILSTGLSARAQILNRSNGGLKLRTSQPVFVGALVQVRMPGEIVTGEVRYCSARDAAFEMGVKISEAW